MARHFARRSQRDPGRAEGAARPRRAPRPERRAPTIETGGAEELRRAQVRDRRHPSRAQPHQAGNRGAARQRIRAGRRRASPASSTPWWRARNARPSRSWAPPKTSRTPPTPCRRASSASRNKSLALDIQDNVLRIFEACNFQDLTGQRIAKVLDDAEIRRGAHRAHDRDLGRHRRLQDLCRARPRSDRPQRHAARPEARRRRRPRVAGRRRRACSPTG